MLQTRNKPRLPIAGTATLDQDGIVVTAVGAIRWGVRNMPADLKRAGFLTTVCRGNEPHNGTYRQCWRVNYSK